MPTDVTSAELMPITALTPAQRARWHAFQAANPALASPYFSLAFADCVAARRSDTQVLVLKNKSETVGFLPLQLSGTGIARPLGGPMGDHHGIIAADNSLPLEAALAANGINVFSFTGALANQDAFQIAASHSEPSWVVDLEAGHDAWLENRRSADAKAMRNIRARQRKLAESGLDIVYRIDDRRPGVLDATLATKRAQYRTTRAFDVFMAQWARQLVGDLFEQQSDELRGCLSTLEIDGQLAAAHFGIRSQGVLHYWFPVFWPDYAQFGPGLQLFLEMVREMSGDGLTSVHLGPGDVDFKRKLANAQFEVASGRIERPSLAASALHFGEGLDRFSRQLPIGRVAAWPGKALHRLDTLAATYCP